MNSIIIGASVADSPPYLIERTDMETFTRDNFELVNIVFHKKPLQI